MDPLGMSSGVPNLLIGAIQASKTLHETIQSFRNYERTIRDLRSELESLIGVLETLKTVVTTDEGPMISMLKIPVLCCHQTCQDFNAVIIKCTKHSAGSRASFRDWAQIRYMGGDIRDFKDMLAGYKSTIAIALGSLNMQNVQVTREALDGYHEMIRETTADLQAHLQDIDDKLAVITNHPQQDTDPAANESIKRMEEEKQSAQQCLLICESARSHLQSLQDGFQPLGIRPDETHAKTAVALSDARDRMVRMISDLQGRLIALSEQSLSTKVVQPRQIEEDRLRLLKEIETARQCLEVCNLAADQASRQRVHVFGDVSADDNSHQVIVSTVGDLLNVKSVRVDRFSTQWLGSMTDASLQRLSSDRAASYSPSAPKEDDPAFRGEIRTWTQAAGEGVKCQAELSD
ncbi:hypothetical protein TrVGV298_000336 [Trichoderma virens]|nr:hypothetical protein TrVGV298_000336 [Trichoderma virens]